MRELLPFLKLYKKHWFGLSLGMLLALLTLIASLGLLTLSGWFISAAAVAGLTIARQSFNYFLPGGGVRGLAIARTAGRWAERVVSHNATFKLLSDLRIHFFKQLAPLVPGNVANLRDADILNRLVADVDAMDHVYLRLISPVVIGALGIVFLTSLLAFFDLELALILGAILTLMLITWPILFYKLGKTNGAELTVNKAQMRIKALDWLQGYSELILFGAEPAYRQQILSEQEKLLANQKKHAYLTGLASALLVLVNGLTLVLVVWIAADGINGQAPDPFVAMFAFATMASFEILMPIAGAFQFLGQTLTSARRLNEIIDQTPAVQFSQQAAVTLEPHQADIEFQSIQFRYPGSTEPVINEVSLRFAPGTRNAILGQTGSGKSTLLHLLTRSWDVDKGCVFLAGKPIQHWSEANLRAMISVVSQRVDILNGTLRDNLLLASPTGSDETFCHCLKQVGLEALLDNLGLDTWLGDGGRQLSGGEKRRIGIARALLHDAPIMLLDEPTEGLDKQTEQSIMSLLNAHFANKTVIFITHRLIDLPSMDSIVLLENGAVVEKGTHSELANQNGRYAQLIQSL